VVTSLASKDSAKSSMDLPPPAPLPPPEMPSKKIPDGARISKYLSAVQDKSDAYSPQLAGCIGACKPAIVAVIQGIQFIAPWYMWLYGWIAHYLSLFPKTILYMVFGIALCFFGGTYVASIAAIEAFRQLGGQKLYAEFEVIKKQVADINKANKKDDEEDLDRDGIADTMQMEPAALAQRKLALAMETVTEPHKLQEAFGALFTAYLSVLATLRLEFARTTAFALGIAEMAKFPLIRVLSVPLTAALGEKLQHWTQTIIETGLTLICVIFAWYLQMIVSAFYSGLRGGRIFADNLVEFLQQKKTADGKPLIDLAPSWLQLPKDENGQFDPNESFLDEFVGYGIAALGFGFQFFNGFSLPFPLNLIFLPLTIIEFFLRVQVSMEGTSALI